MLITEELWKTSQDIKEQHNKIECVAKPSVMATRPLQRWKLLLGKWVNVRMWDLIQANAIDTAVQARDKPWVTSANQRIH